MRECTWTFQAVKMEICTILNSFLDFLKTLKIYLCIYFWLYWVFVAVWAFLYLQQVGATLWFPCKGSSLRWPLVAKHRLLGYVGFSGCSTWAQQLHPWGLEHSLSSGTWAQLLCSMWSLPGQGIEPVSPALAGRFFTTKQPPGKPRIS